MFFHFLRFSHTTKQHRIPAAPNAAHATHSGNSSSRLAVQPKLAMLLTQHACCLFGHGTFVNSRMCLFKLGQLDICLFITPPPRKKKKKKLLRFKKLKRSGTSKSPKATDFEGLEPPNPQSLQNSKRSAVEQPKFSSEAAWNDAKGMFPRQPHRWKSRIISKKTKNVAKHGDWWEKNNILRLQVQGSSFSPFLGREMGESYVMMSWCSMCSSCIFSKILNPMSFNVKANAKQIKPDQTKPLQKAKHPGSPGEPLKLDPNGRVF